MARCKDCLYYKICKSYADDVSGSNRNDDELFYDCSDFKNKADFQEVKHGMWREYIDDYDCDYIECSICGEEFYPPNNEFTFDMMPKYCPNCGAKMDGDVK